ncbi:hypothetical protein Psi01_26330 [Planobispora siamensis]|uniref:Uncharacterized protein n=1 Tax=Planobispora siamensis TaxID=936338 RepID=A0A8J3SD87_9ACTN|nr:hypothetical protein Psi01_26330 [Planobispora siamensis]
MAVSMRPKGASEVVIGAAIDGTVPGSGGTVDAATPLRPPGGVLTAVYGPTERSIIPKKH